MTDPGFLALILFVAPLHSKPVISELKAGANSSHACGFHAYHFPGRFLKAEARWACLRAIDVNRENVILTGTIRAWGEVQIHELGFRTQHAQVLALKLPAKADQELAEQVASLFEVPLLDGSRSLYKHAAAHAGQVPDLLLSKRKRWQRKALELIA